MRWHEAHSLEHIHEYISPSVIRHYWCNSPSVEILEKHGIKAVGDQYGCENIREVVEIQVSKFIEMQWIRPPDDPALISLMSEQLLRHIS